MVPPDTSTLISLIIDATRLLRDQASRHGATDRFSLAQLRVLTRVAETEAPTMTEIAESLAVTSPTATALIDRLVQDHALERVPDEHDRRLVRLRITKTGRATLVALRRQARQRIEALVGMLEPDEQRQLIHILQKMIRSYQP